MSLLGDLCEYRTLKLRHYAHGTPLAEPERQRLEALQRVFELAQVASARAVDARRRYRRFSLELRAELELDELPARQVRILNVSGGGITLTPAPALARGELAVVRIPDDSGAVYRLPIQALWIESAPGGSVLGCAFVGVPSVAPRPVAAPAGGEPLRLARGTGKLEGALLPTLKHHGAMTLRSVEPGLDLTVPLPVRRRLPS